jgi:hypothetical protein
MTTFEIVAYLLCIYFGGIRNLYVFGYRAAIIDGGGKNWLQKLNNLPSYNTMILQFWKFDYREYNINRD